MRTLIDRNALGRHSINKYKFKVLAMGPEREEETVPASVLSGSEASEEPVPQQTAPAERVPAGAEPPASSKDELIESLLKKADEMSSSVIKMQMKLEEAEASYRTQLEAERKKAYEEGVEAGREALQREKEQEQQEGMSRFSASVQTLELRAKEFSEALESVHAELVHAAIDIAREVILIEVGEQSGAIAARMASQLIKELQEASRITLRVNPADHGPLSEAVGSLERVEIVSDSAVSRGGVVAISNAGNIDAEVMKRFERVKHAARSGE
jgi:flagellar assembly protein FliH